MKIKYTKEQLKNSLVGPLLYLRFFQFITGLRWVKRWDKDYRLAEKELSILPNKLKQKGIIFDIGANRGELSYYFAKKCYAKIVYAFEPQQQVFGILRGVAYKVPNIIPICIALSDKATTQTLYIPLQKTGRYTQEASLKKHDKKTISEKIKTQTIDNFIFEQKINNVDFVKCDTEGHEYSIFKGASKMLTYLRPIIYVEIKEENYRNLENIFKKHEYIIYQYDTRKKYFLLLKMEYHQKTITAFLWRKRNL